MMKSAQYSPPLALTIPLPTDIPRSRGIFATTGYGGSLRVRCSDEQYDLVKEEAALLDISLACFCRWVIIHAASSLRKHREEQSDTYDVEVKGGEGLRL
jgi:hypothetical protein